MSLDQDVIAFHRSFSEMAAENPDWRAIANPPPDNFALLRQFSEKYYSAHSNRTLILGINPGRMGSGQTGVPFITENTLYSMGLREERVRRHDLSASFFELVFAAYGGFELFFRDFVLSAVIPVGLSSGNKSINYYDLPKTIGWPTIIESSLNCQGNFTGIARDLIVIGSGKNFSAISAANNHARVFDKIYPLEHPRFIMQYKRSELDRYVTSYVDTLNAAMQNLRVRGGPA